MQSAIDLSVPCSRRALPDADVRSPRPGQLVDRFHIQAREREFRNMLHGYRDSGGLLRGEEVVAALHRRVEDPVSRLARWIVTQQVVSMDWQGDLWLPMFQFEPLTMEPKESVRRVLAELVPAFDAWGLVGWFAQPNSWLNDRAPVALLETELESVLQAARADRFVAIG